MNGEEEEFSIKQYFIPFTNTKAISFIILIGFLVFFNMLLNNFVWDDRTFIQFNPDMRHLDLLYLLKANMFNNVNAGQYRFFVALYFVTQHTIFGDGVFFYHFFQLVIHIGNAVLVFLLLKKYFSKGLTFFLSLVFLLHPIQVESVSYIASSGNPLFTFFGLLAVVLIGKKSNLKKDISIFTLLLFSLFSKETGIIFLFLVVLYRFIFFRTNRMVYVLSGMGTLVIYSFIRFIVAGVYFSKVALAPIARVSLLDRLNSIPAIIFYYLKTFFWPKDLAIQQYWIIRERNFGNFYLPLLTEIILLIIMVTFGLYLKKSNKKTLFLFLFFSVWLVANIFPYLQFSALDMTVADRWFYFPIVGLLGILGFVIGSINKYFVSKTKLLWTIGFLIICFLSIRTVVRNTNWYDPVTLYEHDIKINDNFDLENSLGGELNLIGNSSEAAKHFKKSVAMFPHETNLFNLGLSYELKGDSKKAIELYKSALKSKNYGQVPRPHQHHNVTYIRLAVLLLRDNSPDAENIIRMGTADYPDDINLRYLEDLYQRQKK